MEGSQAYEPAALGVPESEFVPGQYSYMALPSPVPVRLRADEWATSTQRRLLVAPSCFSSKTITFVVADSAMSNPITARRCFNGVGKLDDGSTARDYKRNFLVRRALASTPTSAIPGRDRSKRT